MSQEFVSLVDLLKADDLHHKALSKMFSNEKDAIELVKKKDIITTLEKAVDSAENVSDVIKTIIVKSA
ncbi:MAG: DUF47 family protein [Bacteroidia bacterium]|nr:DUF47 family protein [Bacteroidia bacterium]